MANIDDLVARLAQDAAAVKPAPHPFMLSIQWMGAAAIYLVVSLALSGVRPDLAEKFHSPWFVVEIVVLLGIFIVTSLSTALLAFPDLYQKTAPCLRTDRGIHRVYRRDVLFLARRQPALTAARPQLRVHAQHHVDDAAARRMGVLFPAQICQHALPAGGQCRAAFRFQRRRTMAAAA